MMKQETTFACNFSKKGKKVAEILMIVLATFPSLSAYLWAKHLNFSHERTLIQYIYLAMVLIGMFGTFSLQIYVDRNFRGDQGRDLFATILVILQYFFAIIIFFSTLKK